jgi:hypothetical protein
MKIRPVRAEFVHADGHMDGHTDGQAEMSMLRVFFAILLTRLKLLYFIV